MRRRLILFLSALAVTSLGLPAAAHGSHIMGGSLELRVADDRLQGTITYSERLDPEQECVVGEPFDVLDVTFTDPSLNEGELGVEVFNVRCIPGQRTVAGDFGVDIDDELGLVVEDGVYGAAFSSCCRIDGIENADDSGVTAFRAQVTRNGAAPSSSPTFGSIPVTGVAIGYPYLQNLNASDPDAPLTYASQAGQPTGPVSDVVTFEPDGDVSIPASVTSTFVDGQNYVYKVRVTDAAGNFSERDVLLFVTGSNTPPAFQGLPSSVSVPAGETEVINFTATDPELDQSVSVLAGPLPPWASLSTTPGNPATVELTLSPPLEAAGTSETLSFDAIDNDEAVPLSASATLTVNVSSASEPIPPGGPAPGSGESLYGSSTALAAQLARALDTASFKKRIRKKKGKAIFRFGGVGNWTGLQCALKRNARRKSNGKKRKAKRPRFRPCTSPKKYKRLKTGRYVFTVRAVGPFGVDTTPVRKKFRIKRKRRR